MARPERFELPTSWFVAMRSIQLSYGRNAANCTGDGRQPVDGFIHCTRRDLINVDLIFNMDALHRASAKSREPADGRQPACKTIWRRERDSNPRWAFDPYTLSRGAPSTTRPPLRCQTVRASCSAERLRHTLTGARYKFAPGEFVVSGSRPKSSRPRRAARILTAGQYVKTWCWRVAAATRTAERRRLRSAGVARRRVVRTLCL